MAMTNFSINDPLAVNLWSKSIDVEALKHTDISPLTGDDANSVIHRKTKTSTPQGERFSAPQAAIRAELIADDSCSALGRTVRGFAPLEETPVRLGRRAENRGCTPALSEPIARFGTHNMGRLCKPTRFT